MNIKIYSDGSSDGKSGGKGGWAFLILIDDIKTYEEGGSEDNATNNICEVLAASKGLEYVATNYPQCQDVTLISDSQLALRWASGEYKVKKWHLIPYVIKLRGLFDKLNAKAQWQKGHQGEPNNERCDELAKVARTT